MDIAKLREWKQRLIALLVKVLQTFRNQGEWTRSIETLLNQQSSSSSSSSSSNEAVWKEVSAEIKETIRRALNIDL
jgi:hypothetical protein